MSIHPGLGTAVGSPAVDGDTRPQPADTYSPAGCHQRSPGLCGRSPAWGTVPTFLALVVAANWLTATYGLIPVGFGLTATAGTWAAGLVLVARDVVQDTAGRTAVLALIVVGAALTAVLTTPTLAIASGVAFTVSELADLAVYTPLRRRGWARAVAASSLVGSVVDTALFLTLAGFPLLVALPGQMLVKTLAMLAVVVPVVMIRALLRDRVRAEGA